MKQESQNGRLENFLNYGIDGLISFNNKPLRMMIYLGMFTFSISILYIIYLLINIIISGINIPGYFTTIAAILLLGGIQLISIGVIGEYIGRIYYEVKRRPKYIVQATNLKPSDNENKTEEERSDNQTSHLKLKMITINLAIIIKIVHLNNQVIKLIMKKNNIKNMSIKIMKRTKILIAIRRFQIEIILSLF